MTPDIEKVLAEATPWAVNSSGGQIVDKDGICIAQFLDRGGVFDYRSVCSLAVLAVNSYEADQKRIRELTETLQAYWEDLGTLFKALTEARVYLATLDYHTGKNEIVKQLLIKIDAVLSQAKAVPDNREVYPTGDDL